MKRWAADTSFKLRHATSHILATVGACLTILAIVANCVGRRLRTSILMIFLPLLFWCLTEASRELAVISFAYVADFIRR